MSTFVLYTYQFAPKVNDLEQYSELFPDKDISPKKIMEGKQKVLQSLFDENSTLRSPLAMRRSTIRFFLTPEA